MSGRPFATDDSTENLIYSGCLLILDRVPAAAPPSEVVLTVDDELNQLDDALRRLKVEYDVYFGGGKRPAQDLEWRVSSLLKKHSDSQKLNFTQRFKYNSIAQRFAVMNELWRQKSRIKEEGYRRPQDALLAIQGLRTQEEHEAAAQLSPPKKHHDAEESAYVIECSDPTAEHAKVEALYKALMAAKKAAGEQVPPGKLDSFAAFVKKKTEQMRHDFHCAAVEYRVEMQDGRAVLKARAK